MTELRAASTVVHSGRHLYLEVNAIYELLAFVEAGLVLDVGAAAGGVSSLIAARSPDSRIVAFEPFPGNWQLLQQAVGDLDQVTIDHRAASDTSGPGHLYVSAVVAGDEPGWEERAGYSSAGTLIDASDNRLDQAIDVDMIRIDTLFSERVRFLKIDVQGAELAVLSGASGLLERGLIDLMWVEFTGELAILDYVRSHGFDVFDSQYLLIPRSDPPDPADWMIEGTKNLSNGKTAYVAWPHDYPRADVAYCEWFAEQRARFIIQTDLTLVHAGFMPNFLKAAGEAMARA